MDALSFQLSEIYKRALEEGDTAGYLASLSEEGLKWWFQMDTPSIQVHLLPLNTITLNPQEIPLRVRFLTEASKQTIPYEEMESFYRAFMEEGDYEGASAAAGAAVASVWDSGREFERYRLWYKRINALLRDASHISPLASASLYGFKGLVELTTGEIKKAYDTFLLQREHAEEANSCPLRIFFAVAATYSLIWMGRLSEAEVVIKDAEALCETGMPNIVVNVYFQTTRGLYYYVTGQVQKAREILTGVVGSPFFDDLPPPGYYLGYGHLLLTLAALSDEEGIEGIAQRLRQKALKEINHFHLSYLYYNLGSAYLLLGRPQKALVHVRESMKRADLSHSMTARQIPALLFGQVLSDTHREKEALEHLLRWFRRWSAKDFNLLASTGALEIARIYLRMGEFERAREYFEKALTFMPEVKEIVPLNRSKRFFQELKESLYGCERSPGITIQMERSPVCIITFGDLLIRVADRMIYDRKWRGGRTKTLLKALVVLGGKKVSYDTLIDMLWPDMEGDRAENNLKVAISRLRQLGVKKRQTPLKWILVKDRKVSLAGALCSVDSILFHETLRRNPADEIDRDILRDAINLYRDDFLPNDDSEVWIIRHREMLRGEFVRGCLLLADLLRKEGETAEAIPYLEKAVERDPLNEELYEALMGVHLERGYPSQALRVYLSAEEALRRELGISPGPKLKALAERAGLKG